MVGYNEEELNNIKWQELVHPEDIEKNLALFEEIIRKKRDTYQLERRFIKKNGEIIYTDSNISCVRENDGTVKYFLVTIHDITKSKKAEEKIRYLARLPEENPDPVLRLTKGGSIDYVNPAARELMKIWEFEENGKVTRKWQRIINSVLRHGLTWFQEEKIGSRLFSIAVFPVVEEGYVNLYGRDITERRRAEKDLTASERRYKILYDTSLEAIIMLIPGKGFIGGNKASIELFGLENEEELLQKDMLGLSPEYQPDGGLSSVKIREINRIVMKKGAHFFEWVYKKKNGEEFFARVVLTKVEQEENVFFHATIRDVTEAKKLQEKLIKNEKLASLGKLVSDMAHEVNNPLMIVSGRAQISLMPETSAEEIQENLNVIIDQCMRAKEIIQRLLAFSRPSKGVISEIDLNKAVDCIVKLMEHQYALINIKMITCYEKDLPRILGDDKQLHEVFMNLIKNASEAMPEGGTITVVTRKENNEAVVEIKDTGEGISEKNIQKIFDPFFTTKINGTGLGLSVCYGLIKDHDGQMLVNSKQAEGTVVTIRFPGLKKGDKNRDYPVKK
jgi:two-component system sporulation sensor kinase A